MNDSNHAKSGAVELFDVILTKAGPNMIRTIIAVQDLNGLGVGHAKSLVGIDWIGPQFVLKGVSHDLAEAGRVRLQDIGGQADIVEHTPAQGVIDNALLIPQPDFVVWAQARQRVKEAIAALHKAQEDLDNGLTSIPTIVEREEALNLRQAEEWAAYRALTRSDVNLAQRGAKPPPIE